MYLRNCRIVPELSGMAAFNLADVIISDGLIEEVLPAGAENTPPDAIDCGGKTLLPGLIDLHNHILMYDMNSATTDPQHTCMSALVQGAAESKMFLEYGYTTIRDLGSSYNAAIHVRDLIEKGVFIGPRIITSGNIIAAHDSRKIQGNYNLLADGCDEIRKAVRFTLAIGADIIKIYNCSPVFDKKRPCAPLYTPEELETLVETARFKGTYVAAHCHDTLSINMSLDAGIYTIEHASRADDRSLEKLAKGGQYLVPTVAPYLTLQKVNVFDKTMLNDLLEATTYGITKAQKGGLKIGFGSDMQVTKWHDRIGFEFKARKEYFGFDNKELLKEATVYNAEILGMEDSIGQVKKGLRADLIVVDGSPDEDIAVMYKKPDMVFMGGVKVV